MPTSADPSALDLRGFNERYAAAMLDGDLDALLAMYDDDAIMQGPGFPPVEGADAFRSYYAATMSAGLEQVRLTSVRSRTLAGVVIDTGRYAMTLTPPDGQRIEAAGTYLHAFRQDGDGEWRLWHDMFAPAD